VDANNEDRWDAAGKRIDRIKLHFKENYKSYLIGAGCLSTGYILGRRMAPDVIQTFTNSTDNVAPIINRSKNVDLVIKYLNVRNYNAKPVRCVETNETWPSQEEAAEAFQMAATILSKHLNGKYPDAKGFHFEWI
jgi:hypothetical protein